MKEILKCKRNLNHITIYFKQKQKFKIELVQPIAIRKDTFVKF